ncbi:MAG: 1,4-alpha-glucan branching protein GlgB [Acidobacteriota bacterium]
MTGRLSLLTDDDLFLFNEGSHFRLWEKLGAHPLEVDGRSGAMFSVWAPNADYVSVVSDRNAWDPGANPLTPRGSSGIWEGFVPGFGKGTLYKFHIASPIGGYRVEKSDPLALFSEVAPKTASIVWDLDYEWGDGAWMSERRRRNALSAPMSIYEVHLGSWMRDLADGFNSFSYRELAPRLAAHVRDLGFTHVELLPVMEHPFFGSWGYQITGYFAPTSRYGTPQDLMFLVDTLHRHGIGVILDWVPSHFPTDGHGLAFFDGTHLYEHADSRQGLHPEWGSLIFNYGRHEVASFLISNALFWLEKYHADGLRVDAVASMLYLDYGRKDGEWVPNRFGGRENLDAVEFLRRFNAEVYARFPDVQTIAEESTAWPMVSRPTYVGGLGFGLKWDMGWMHDTLKYMARNPVHRRFHHSELTFRGLYAFTENYVLPLSHDEVVHGKGSLLGKMAGDEWQMFANLRLLYGSMFAQPGKKMLFMGAELAPWQEWAHDGSLEWDLLGYPMHEGIRRWLADLNHAYAEIPALHELDIDPAGFAWIDCNDADQSTLAWLRRSRTDGREVLVACNFTPVPRHGYLVGAPRGGTWREILNSDAACYGGSNLGNGGAVEAHRCPWHGQPWTLEIVLPPLASVFFVSEGG